MPLESELFRQLSGWPNLSALVTNRIYPSPAKQGCGIPYVTYDIITDEPNYTHGGMASLSETLVQFNCYGLTPDQARSVGQAVKGALDAWTSPAVDRAFIQNGGRSLYDPDAPKLSRVIVEASVWNRLMAP